MAAVFSILTTVILYYSQRFLFSPFSFLFSSLRSVILSLYSSILLFFYSSILPPTQHEHSRQHDSPSLSFGSGAGTWEIDVGAILCKNCDKGKYRPSEATGTFCTLCPSGFYSLGAAIACNACPNGRFSAKEDSTTDLFTGCENCPAGFFNNDNVQVGCDKCSVGKISTPGASVCTLCPNGKYSTPTPSSQSSMVYTFCQQCPAGYFDKFQEMDGEYNNAFNISCSECLVGTFAKAGKLICEDCTDGKYSHGTQETNSSVLYTKCENCPAGFYRSAARNDLDKNFIYVECKHCIDGTFSAAGVRECQDCPEGEISKEGLTCESCPAGYYKQGVRCQSCVAGQFSGSGARECQPCQPGKFAANPDLSITEPLTSCENCRAGLFGADGVNCTKCPVGFQSSAASGECGQCARGMYASSTGSTDCALCIHACDSTSPCSSFSSTTGSGALSAQLKNVWYSDEEGQRKCKKCDPKSPVTTGFGCRELVSKDTIIPPFNLRIVVQEGAGKGAGNVVSVSWECVASSEKKTYMLEYNYEKGICATDRATDKNLRTPTDNNNNNTSNPVKAVKADKVDNTIQRMRHQCCSQDDWTPSEKNESSSTSISFPKDTCSPGERMLHNIVMTDQSGLPLPAWCNSLTMLRVRSEIRPEYSEEGKEGMSAEYLTFDGPWYTARSCDPQVHYLKRSIYLNLTKSYNPRDWECVQCFSGSSCYGSVLDEEVRPLFGWYMVNKQWNERSNDWGGKHIERSKEFIPCRHPAACLGAVNDLLINKYTLVNPSCANPPCANYDNEMVGKDPALLDLAPQCDQVAGYRSACPTKNGDDSSDGSSDGSDGNDGSSNTTKTTQMCTLCTRCMPKHRRTNGGFGYECQRCPDDGTNKAFLVLGALVIMGMVFVLLSMGMEDVLDGNASDALTRVFINFLQVIAIFATFPLAWPEPILKLFEVQGVASTIGEFLLNPDCEVSVDILYLYYAKAIAWSFMPVGIIVILYVSWKMWACVLGKGWKIQEEETPEERERRMKSHVSNGGKKRFNLELTSRKPTPKDHFVCCVVILMHVTYPNACQNTFRLLACTEVDTRYYLQADLQQECWEGSHFAMVVCVCLPQVFLYVIGMPLASFTMLVKNRKKLHLARTKYRWGMLYVGLRKDRYYWEAVVCARKAIIYSLSVIGSANAGLEVQTHLAMLVLLGALVAHLIGRPYMKGWELLDKFETTGLVVCFLMMWSGIVFYSDSDRPIRELTTILLFTFNFGFTAFTIMVLIQQKAHEESPIINSCRKMCCCCLSDKNMRQMGSYLPHIKDGGEDWMSSTAPETPYENPFFLNKQIGQKGHNDMDHHAMSTLMNKKDPSIDRPTNPPNDDADKQAKSKKSKKDHLTSASEQESRRKLKNSASRTRSLFEGGKNQLHPPRSGLELTELHTTDKGIAVAIDVGKAKTAAVRGKHGRKVTHIPADWIRHEDSASGIAYYQSPDGTVTWDKPPGPNGESQ